MNSYITAVQPLENYELLLTFANGEQRIFDHCHILIKPP